MAQLTAKLDSFVDIEGFSLAGLRGDRCGKWLDRAPIAKFCSACANFLESRRGRFHYSVTSSDANRNRGGAFAGGFRLIDEIPTSTCEVAVAGAQARAGDE